MKYVMKYFFRGLLFVAPIAITVFVFYYIFDAIDKPLGELTAGVFGWEKVRGVGFVVGVVFAFVLLTVIGVLTSNFITRRLMRMVDDLFDKFPLVKLLHSSLKDLIGAFVGEKKSFDTPVFVTLIPGAGVKAVGFITRKTMESWGLADDVAVYLPQSYNFAGNLIVVPREQVTPIAVQSSDVMQFLVSGGVSGGEEAEAQLPSV